MDGSWTDELRAFYETNRRELFTYAVSLTRCQHAAEDVLHSVFYQLLRRNQAPRELRPYVYRALRNTALSLLRDNHRTLESCSIFAVPEPHAPQEQLAQREEADRLLLLLSSDERECIVMKLYNEMTFNEIAAARRVSIHTAASWYRRGMEKMKGLVEEQKHE
jgi:RNA polymerase sigma-70 factor, ECF subfamily